MPTAAERNSKKQRHKEFSKFLSLSQSLSQRIRNSNLSLSQSPSKKLLLNREHKIRRDRSLGPQTSEARELQLKENVRKSLRVKSAKKPL